MIISENEKNRIKKLHRNQFVLNEGMFVSPQGELMDDDMESIKIGDETKVLVWVGSADMVFPGHYGTVSVIGTDERNGKPKGVLIDEELQDDDESMLYRQGYLDWDENKEMWDFYPYYSDQSPSLNEESEPKGCYMPSEDDEKEWEKELTPEDLNEQMSREKRKRKQRRKTEIMREYIRKVQNRASNMPSCRKGNWVNNKIRKKENWLNFRMGLN